MNFIIIYYIKVTSSRFGHHVFFYLVFIKFHHYKKDWRFNQSEGLHISTKDTLKNCIIV